MISVRRREQADGVAVIFTALDSEYGAIREHLDGQLGEREERGSLYEVGSFRGRKATWTVAVAQTEAGNKDAAAQVERAVRLFSPQVIFFTGVAGGRKDVRLGDVVAADIVYDYQTGKDTRDGFLPGSRPHRPTHELVQRAKQVQRDGQWKQRIKPACLDPAPHALVKPLAAGDVVLADRRSETARFLSEHYASTVAVEMEAHGFLHGAYINAGLSSLVVRGIPTCSPARHRTPTNGGNRSPPATPLRSPSRCSAASTRTAARLRTKPGTGSQSTAYGRSCWLAWPPS